MRLWSRLRRSQVARRAVDATDFGPSRNSGGGVPVAAHSLQECRRAIARRRRQFAHLEFLDPLCGMAQVHGRPTRGGRINPRCGDPDRRTGVVRLGTACASAARVAEPSLGLSHFSTPCVWHGASAWSANAWRESQGEVWRCKPAHQFLRLGKTCAVFDGRLEK